MQIYPAAEHSHIPCLQPFFTAAIFADLFKLVCPADGKSISSDFVRAHVCGIFHPLQYLVYFGSYPSDVILSSCYEVI